MSSRRPEDRTKDGGRRTTAIDASLSTSLSPASPTPHALTPPSSFVLRLSYIVSRIDRHAAIVLLAWLTALWALVWATLAWSGITPDFVGDPSAARFTIENEPLWLYVWTRWDGQWYLNIAHGGYGAIPYDAPFFPMYPMLAAGLSAVTTLPEAATGLIVSYICLALGLVYLYRLARLDFDRGTTVRAVVTLLLYPTAFFLVAMYTESLVLLLTSAALYYARVGKWWLVAPIALLAGLSKIMAVALVVALACELFLGEANSPDGREGKSWQALLHPRRLLSRLSPAKVTALLAAPVGLLLYMSFLAWRFGDPFSFINALPVRFWRGRFSFFEQEWRLVSSWFQRGMTLNDWSKVGDFVAFLLMLGLAIYAARYMRLSYAALMVTFLVLLVISGDLLSLNRYILTVAPVFIGIAALASRRSLAWGVMLALFVPLQAYFAVRFFLWGWVA